MREISSLRFIAKLVSIHVIELCTMVQDIYSENTCGKKDLRLCVTFYNVTSGHLQIYYV